MERSYVKRPDDYDVGKSLASDVFLLLFFALIITTFVMLWYSGGDFASLAQSSEIVKNISVFAIVIFLFTGILGYVFFFQKKFLRPKFLTLIYTVIFITVAICCISADLLNVYAIPLQLASIIICLLLGIRLATVSNIVVSQMLLIIMLVKQPFTAASMSNIAASIFCNTICGFVMLYLVFKKLSRFKFTLVGFGLGIGLAPFALIVSLASGDTGIILWTHTMWVVISNIIAIICYMPLLPIFESAFNIVTDFKLDELCSFTSPLLKRLADEAPGTFNHSIIVGNLAESCALAIGENVHLARAAAYYHDVGKLKSPEFFIENQKNGYNPHDDLIPEVSVSMISKHTKNGYTMLKEAHLPEEIALIAAEHHGTSPIKAFYYKVLKITEGGVDDDRFRYEGPKPSTKISAIMMICDSAEATVRAMGLKTSAEIEDLIHKQIIERLEDGQFTDCDITMLDLSKIQTAITTLLSGIHHSRIKYNK